MIHGSSLVWSCSKILFLSQETLYRSESCRRRLRRTAPYGSLGMASQVRPADATGVSPSPVGTCGSCPLHLLELSNPSFVIGMPNRCCILELRAVLYATSSVFQGDKA